MCMASQTMALSIYMLLSQTAVALNAGTIFLCLATLTKALAIASGQTLTPTSPRGKLDQHSTVVRLLHLYKYRLTLGFEGVTGCNPR